MVTISCYTFHPLIQRFVRLYRYVQVVSACLTCLLSMLCCSCGEVMRISRSSSATTASYEKTSSAELDTGLSKERVTIDITPAAGDSDIMEKVDREPNNQADFDFTKKGDRELGNQAELEAVVVAPVKKFEGIKKEVSVVPVHKKTEPAPAAEKQKLPSLAALIQNQAALEKVLHSEGCSKMLA